MHGIYVILQSRITNNQSCIKGVNIRYHGLSSTLNIMNNNQQSLGTLQTSRLLFVGNMDNLVIKLTKSTHFGSFKTFISNLWSISFFCYSNLCSKLDQPPDNIQSQASWNPVTLNSLHIGSIQGENLFQELSDEKQHFLLVWGELAFCTHYKQTHVSYKRHRRQSGIVGLDKYLWKSSEQKKFFDSSTLKGIPTRLL